MLLGILSDSHDHLDRLRTAMEAFRERGVEALLHAGDYVSPFSVPLLGKLGVPLYGVLGNNDGELHGLHERFAQLGAKLSREPSYMELDGCSILLMHEPVGMPSAYYSALDLVVYGHTHKVNLLTGDTTIVNPGEACGWLTGTATVAVYDTKLRKAQVINLA